MIIEPVDAIEAMHNESPFFIGEFNRKKSQALIDYCVKDGFFYFNGKCLMLGKTYIPWYCDELCSSDLLIYTCKEHRGKGLAKDAINEFILWSKRKDCNSITISQSSGLNQSAFNSIAKGMNFQKIGEVYNVQS